MVALLTRIFDGFVDPKAQSPATAGATTRPSVELMDRAVLLSLLAAPVVYLSIRHGIHACLYLLAILAGIDFLKSPSSSLAAYRDDLKAPWVPLLLLSFAGLFLATVATQLLGWHFHLASLDSPSKIMLGGVVFLFLRRRDISFARVLEFALPAGILTIQLVLWMFPDTSAAWDGSRYATRFVDPNSLGSQSLILTLMCLFTIGLFGREKRWLLALKIVAVLVGFSIALHAKSRGGWLAIPPMLVLWLVLYFSRTRETGFARYFVPLSLFSIAIGAMFLGYENSTIISSRGNFAYEDMCDWLDGKNYESPVGIRLSMWKISLALAQDSPFIGYGKTDFKALLAHSPLDIPAYRSAIDVLAFAGPHSDILSKMLTTGLIGLTAYFASLFVPWLYFWRHRSDEDSDRRAASHFGMYFLTGVFVCGLSNEMLSLKYLCSFYAVMIAGLAADVARRSGVRAPDAGRVK